MLCSAEYEEMTGQSALHVKKWKRLTEIDNRVEGAISAYAEETAMVKGLVRVTAKITQRGSNRKNRLRLVALSLPISVQAIVEVRFNPTAPRAWGSATAWDKPPGRNESLLETRVADGG
jgi:hypothetical protein